VPATIRRRMRLRALRGAITVAENEAGAILAATDELVREVMERNTLRADDVVSCIFTCTEDLDADSLPRVIRLLVHCYADPQAPAHHVYLREAASLRRDLEGAQ
jgi:chorismate mutase